MLLLADHLDAALAAGEDLLTTRLAALADLDTVEDAFERELSRFVDRLERLEATLVGRVLHARQRLEVLPKHDAEFRPLARLFVASTDSLLSLVAYFGKQTTHRFDTGNDRLPFLRQRGLIARDAASLPIYEAIEVSETYRVGGLLELGPLMDMIATLLDVLDGRYDLYGSGTEDTANSAAEDLEEEGIEGKLDHDFVADKCATALSNPSTAETGSAEVPNREPVPDDATALHSPVPRL